MRRITMKYALSLICLLFAGQATSQWDNRDIDAGKVANQTSVFLENDNQQNNEIRSRYKLPRNASGISSGDLEADGDNDIVVGHLYNSQTNWSGITSLNNFNNGYFNWDSNSMDGHHRNIVLDRLDSNLKLDVVTQGWNYINSQISIVFDNNYLPPNIQAIDVNSYADDIATGDINNDNLKDVIFCSNNGKLWGWIENYGNRSFSVPEYHALENYFPVSITAGDLNEDGRDDIVVCGQNTEIYFSYPNGFESLLLEDSDAKEKVFIVDFDLDGINDIITFHGIYIFNVSVLKMFKNHGEGIFDTIGEFYFNALSSRAFLSDFNNDSLPDALFTLSDNSGLVIYYNQGDFQLGDSSFISLPAYQNEGLRNCCCADFDWNGYNDIAITRGASIVLPDNLVILFNDGDGNFGEDPITEINNSQKVNCRYFLSCYPNPFSSSTSIEFHLLEESTVALEVYDYTGKKLKTIKLGLLEQGRHSKTLNFGELAPGVYFYSLVVNGRLADMQKMIVR